MRKGVIPAVRGAGGLAPRLLTFSHLTERNISDLDRSAAGFEADGVTYGVIGSQKREAGIEQMRTLRFGPGEQRGDAKAHILA